jgi:hypothetical protein
MPNLARIKLPSRIRLAIASTSVKPALTVLSVLILAPLAAMLKEVPSTPALTQSKAFSPARSPRLQAWLQL